MSLVSAALLGLGLGVRHAFEADHVAAVCALVARRGTVARAARSGALWGLGHGAVIIVAGGALVLLGARVPGPLAAALDAAVAVMLVGLGISALRRASEGIATRADHEAEHAHFHAHGHAHDVDHDTPGATRRPILIGLLHGASGTAALTLLVAATIPQRAEALAFITLFGLASIVGMAAAAAVLAWPLRKAALHAPAIARGLSGMAGVGSIAAGVMVAWIALMTSSLN
jgi:nickel/cobalt transporter (NicO) family protein